MTILPNPFQSAGEPAAMLSADSAAGPCFTDPTVPAAGHFDTGAATPVAPVEAAASPNLAGADDAAADHRFVLDEEAFLNDIEPLPAFLVAPSQSYLRANDIFRVLRVIAGVRA
jgi:hypothetical protein